MSKTNPNGANQFTPDPRQKLLWDYYINPKSETFSNAYRSAMRAGYEETSASVITTEKWFEDKLRRLNMLGKAEKVLDETLEMDDTIKVFDNTGEEVFEKRDPALTKIKQDTAKFIAERLGKDEGYSSRTEMTGPDGEPLLNEEKKKQADHAIKEFIAVGYIGERGQTND